MKAAKVNAGLAESNDKLLPGLWRELLHVTCGLTACTPGSAPGPTLGNEYGKTLPFTMHARYAGGTSYGPTYLSVCVCLSVTSQRSAKTAKRRITQTTPHDSPGTLVF